MRERFNIVFVCVTLFIGRIVFDLMANTIFIRDFGHGIFFHYFTFPVVDGSSVEDS
jgi:hypothetical protein